MKEIILGLDIGKASVGFALVDKSNNYKIIKAGVRIFDAPESPNKPTSLSLERGKCRRARNSNKNEFNRTKNIVKSMLKYNLLDAKSIREYSNDIIKKVPKSKKKHLFYIKTAQYLFNNRSNANDILSLRAKALNHKLSNLQFARLLYNMNKHRGITYDDISEVKEGSKLTPDQKNLKDGFEKYQDEYINSDKSYETVGIYLYENYKDKFRNSNKNYLFTIPRDDLKTEIKIIFEKQREFKNSFATFDFEKEYLEWFLWEKDSPDSDTLVSNCIFNENEKSAHKHHFVSQLYISLEKLHNLRFREVGTKEYQELSTKQHKLILDNSFKKKKGQSYKDIKKILSLENIEFKGILDEDKPIVKNFAIFIDIKKILNLEFNPLEELQKEDNFFDKKYKKIITILAYKPKDKQKKENLKQLNLTNEQIDQLLKLNLIGHLTYSYDVIKKMCIYMLDGLNPHNAKEKIKDEYGIKIIDKKAYLPPILNTDFPLKNNHTVIRALSQVRVVINDILKYYRKQTKNSNWTFDKVVIELAREMNTTKQIQNINKNISVNTKANQNAKEFCEKYNIHNPTNEQILKAKLWILQDGIDPYIWIKNDNNKNVEQYKISKMEETKLFAEDYCQIEHTLPFSRSLDDSQSNKTLVLTKTNQDKGDKTPYEYLTKDEFQKFEIYLRNKDIWKKYGDARIRKLLMKDFKGIDGFKQRDIVDTQIISKYAGLYIDKYLKFWNNPNFNGKRRVFANNGKITSILRKSWAIGKKNRDNHLHHAEDAILIACSTPSLIKNISTFINLQTQLTTGKLTIKKFDYLLQKHSSLKKYILEEISKQNISLDDKNISSTIFKIIANKNYPYRQFRDDFKDTITHAPVTHFVKQKINGSIHDDTIKPNDRTGMKIRDGIARNGAFIRYDVFKIENAKGKISYDFVNITAQYNGKNVEKLPTPILKENEKITFIFSVFKNDLLSYSIKDGSKIIGNFLKVPSSIVIRESKNLETNLFKKQLKGFTLDILGTDDINIKDIKDKILNLKITKTTKQNITSQWGLSKLCNYSKLSELEAQEDRTIEIINAIKGLMQDFKLIFTMSNVSYLQTKLLKKNLINNQILQNNINVCHNMQETIFIIFNESGYEKASRTDGKTDIINLKKLKVNCLGEDLETTQETRMPLK